MKKGVYLLGLLFALMFLVNFVSAEVTDCVIESSSCTTGYTAVMKLSSSTNAHGSLISASDSYSTYLCCDGATSTGTTCTGNNKVLGLSSSTNAHAQIPSYTSYNYHVCYEDLSCTYVTSTSCPSAYPIQTVSLSAISNAHLADFSFYPYKICCASAPGAICGNSLIESGEECDDGNTNNYDGCSYSACTVESGYTCYQPIANGPSCCYSDNPSTFFLKDGNFFYGGSIVEGNSIDLYIGETYCLATGTQRTISIYERKIGSDVLITSINVPAGSASFWGTWLVSASDLAKLGTGTSSIYFSMDEPSSGLKVQSDIIDVIFNSVCGNGVIEDPESCDDNNVQDGDGCSSSCAVEDGWTCQDEPSVCSPLNPCVVADCPAGTTCNPLSGACIPDTETCASLNYECGTVNGESCGTCGSGEQCVSGICEVIQCSINSALWGETQVTEGTQVNLNVELSGCSGAVLSFEILERDGALNPDDSVSINPPSQTISSDSVDLTAVWTAEYQSDIDGLQTDPPEYYFIANIDSGVLTQESSNQLEVLEQNVAQCLGISSCADYTENECGVLSCSSTSHSDISYYENGDGDRCSEISDWGCVWDSINQVCNSNQEITTQCGTCGNYLVDYGEECDDGNSVSGDGCSSICEFEGLSTPCPIGTTLCSDGSCSIECLATDTGPSSCDYDGICENNEGCTCKDCDSQLDSCTSGTVCNLEDSFCCDPQSDGVCNPYCSFSDPDCGTGTCGNGFREFGEQCDDGNVVFWDGCSGLCKFESLSAPCREGTALCSDGSCSYNCFYTDKGYSADVSDNCGTGLTYSLTDNACCDSVSDLVCNPYCSFSDPDCEIKDTFSSVGSCNYLDNSQDDCEDGILERNLTAVWVGESEQPVSCKNVVDRLICPAQIEVPFFSVLQFVLAIILIVLIYFLIKSHMKERYKRYSKRKIHKKKNYPRKRK